MPIKPDNRDQGAYEERGKILRKVRILMKKYYTTRFGDCIPLCELRDWIQERHTRVNKRKGGLGKQ